MSSRCDRDGGARRARPPGVALALAVSLFPCLAHAAPLSVCIDTSSDSAAMDRRVAAAVAAGEHVPLAVHAFDGSGDDDGYDPRNFHKMAGHDCALIMGFPVDLTREAVPQGLLGTRPYARIGFVLVEPRARHEGDLADFPQGSDVGVTYLTPPNLYFEAHPNVTANVFDTEAETMRSLISHQTLAVLVWRPTVIGYQASHPGAPPLAIHDLREPHMQFEMVALYDRSDAAEAAAFERAVSGLRASGALTALVTPFADPAPNSPAPSLPAGRTTPAAAAAKHAAVVSPALVRYAENTGLTATDAGSAPPALYTADQAASGSVKFAANCAVCHGKDLTGIAGPALKGRNFASAKAAFAVSDVFRIVTNNMPATRPASLPRRDYVEIMAFLLQQNGYPSGKAQLTFQEAINSRVPLIYRGP